MLLSLVNENETQPAYFDDFEISHKANPQKLTVSSWAEYYAFGKVAKASCPANGAYRGYSLWARWTSCLPCESYTNYTKNFRCRKINIKCMEINYESVFLSVQRALWGEVYPAIRAIAVDFSENHIHLRYYLDREPNQGDKEGISCVMCEVMADFTTHLFGTEECIFSLEYMRDLEPLKGFAYVRKEKSPTQPYIDGWDKFDE
jgi:hypothetical protein